MNWILLLLAAIILFLILKNFKHHLFLKTLKLFTLILIAILVLFALVQYTSIGNYFDKEEIISKTGATVFDAVKGSLDIDSAVGKADLNNLLNTGIEIGKN